MIAVLLILALIGWGLAVVLWMRLRRYASPADELLQAASELTSKAESLPASGEYKRHQVFAQLIDRFPNRSKRELARAIEASLP
jgi:hypothetical protein